MQTGLRQVGDTVEDVGEPSLRVDVVELRGADERVHHRRPYAAAIRPGEEPRENGGEKLVHGSGGIVSLRAEQNSAR